MPHNLKNAVPEGRRIRGYASSRSTGAALAIPVTRVSTGIGGWADLILTKDSRSHPLCHQCTSAVFLGLTAIALAST